MEKEQRIAIRRALNEDSDKLIQVSSWQSARKSYCSGRLSTVDLLVLTSLDQLLFIMKILFTFITKQSTFIRRSAVLSLSPQLVLLGCMITLKIHVQLGISKLLNLRRYIRPEMSDFLLTPSH